MIIKQSHQKQNNPDGFVLPLVITVGLIMLAGSAAMLARSFGGLVGSTRLEQSRQAKAIAGNRFGLARLFETGGANEAAEAAGEHGGAARQHD